MNKIDVLSLPRMDHNPYQTLLASHLEVVGVHTHVVRKGIVAFIYDIAFAKADIIHIHFTHFLFQNSSNKKRPLIIALSAAFVFLVLIRYRKLLGAKIIYTFHNNLSHEQFYPKIERLVLHRILHMSSNIFAHFNEARDFIHTSYSIDRAKISIIPHGDYSGYYKNTMSFQEARKLLDIDPKTYVYLFFGNIRSYKGIPKLIHTFKKLQQTNTLLYIVGNPANSEIKQLIEKAIESLPTIRCVYEFIPNDTVQIYMNAANVIVLPYRDVFTSGIAHLALTFNKPFIAPNINALKEFKDTALLYDSANPHGLYEALCDAPKFTQDYTRAYTQTTWDSIAKQTATVYLKT
ncbi:MAG: glycosyltransferase [Patescibacteria group bacterium]